MSLFHVGHLPIFIPWSDITVSEKKSFFTMMTEFRFSRVAGAYLRVSPKLADQIMVMNTTTGGQRRA
jgi:hypothetical protein